MKKCILIISESSTLFDILTGRKSEDNGEIRKGSFYYNSCDFEVYLLPFYSPYLASLINPYRIIIAKSCAGVSESDGFIFVPENPSVFEINSLLVLLGGSYRIPNKTRVAVFIGFVCLIFVCVYLLNVF